MAFDDCSVSRRARVFAAAQVIGEAGAGKVLDDAYRKETIRAILAGWSEVLAVAQRAQQSDIPASGTRITLRDRAKAARVVVLEAEPLAGKDIMLGLHIFEMAQYAFDKVVRDYGPRTPRG